MEPSKGRDQGNDNDQNRTLKKVVFEGESRVSINFRKEEDVSNLRACNEIYPRSNRHKNLHKKKEKASR